MKNLHNDYCDDCQEQQINLAANSHKKVFKPLLKAVEKAYKRLHQKKSYKADDILQYSEIIEATNDVFQKALSAGIKDNVIPAKMRSALDEDVFVFSALKTHAQLFEASRMLTNEDGTVKSFNKFSQDVQKLKKDYNQNYLEAEYQFAVSASQQAARWADVEDSEDRYNLQYRTANDDRVRDSHYELHGITLPASDKFWDEYYPPNGWRCRCTAVEVLKKKYKESDAQKSKAKGEKATSKIGKDGKNRLEIFRFNPGKQKVIFPPNHPYQPKGCNGNVSSLKGVPEFFLSADSDKCKVKNEAKKLWDTLVKKNKIKEDRKSLYDTLKNDKQFKDVKFNESNAGLKAIHIDHNIDKVLGFHEINAHNILYKDGYESILLSEKGFSGKKIEGTLNGYKNEIKTLLGESKRTITKRINQSVQKGAEVATLYFPNGITEEKLNSAINMYVGELPKLIIINKDKITRSDIIFAP